MRALEANTSCSTGKVTTIVPAESRFSENPLGVAQTGILTLKITAGWEFRLEYETVSMTSANSNRSNEPLPSQN